MFSEGFLMARGMDNTSASILAFILTGGIFGAIIGGSTYIQVTKRPSDRMAVEESEEEIQEPFDQSGGSNSLKIKNDQDDDDFESGESSKKK